MTTYQAAFLYLQQFLTRTFTLPGRSFEAYQQLRGTLELSEWEYRETIVEMEAHFNVVLLDEVLTPKLTVGELCTLISQQAERVGAQETIDYSLKDIPDERELATDA
jgi:hypothetical protein